MPSGKEAHKTAISCRLNPQNLERLRAIAGEEGRTVSTLINMAIEEFVARLGGGLPESSNVAAEELPISLDDLKKVTHVVETMGTAVSLKLLLDIIKAIKTKEG